MQCPIIRAEKILRPRLLGHQSTTTWGMEYCTVLDLGEEAYPEYAESGDADEHDRVEARPRRPLPLLGANSIGNVLA